MSDPAVDVSEANVTAAELAAEAEMAAVEQAKALAAAQALAVKAAKAQQEAERAAREAREAEEAAMVEAEQNFPTPVTAEAIRVEEYRDELAARKAGPGFGTSSSIGYIPRPELPPQDMRGNVGRPRPRRSEDYEPIESLYRGPLENRDGKDAERHSGPRDEGDDVAGLAASWRRREEEWERERPAPRPREFTPAPQPSKPAWTRPDAQSSSSRWADEEGDGLDNLPPMEPLPHEERDWGDLRSRQQAAQASSMASSMDRSSPNKVSDNVKILAPPPRSPAWQADGSSVSSRPPPPPKMSLAEIQQLEQKVEQLVEMGFDSNRASDALQSCQGDVSKAAIELGNHAKKPAAWGGGKALTDKQAWDELRQREEDEKKELRNRPRSSREKDNEPVVKKPPAWSPPTGKVMLMTRNTACNAAGGGASSNGGGGGGGGAEGGAPQPPASPQLMPSDGSGGHATNGHQPPPQPPPMVMLQRPQQQPPPRPPPPQQMQRAPPPPSQHHYAQQQQPQPPPPYDDRPRPHPPGGMIRQPPPPPQYATQQPHMPPPRAGPPPQQPPQQPAQSASAAIAALSLAEKVSLIKAELVLPAGMPMAAAVAAANSQMGLSANGPLPSQADQLLAIMGLPRGGGGGGGGPHPPPPPMHSNGPPQVMLVPPGGSQSRDPARRNYPAQMQPPAEFAPRVMRR